MSKRIQHGTLNFVEAWPGSIDVDDPGNGRPTRISALCKRAWGDDPPRRDVSIMLVHEDDCPLYRSEPRCTCPPPVVHTNDCSLLRGGTCDCVDEDDTEDW